jgi:hypothetical protein
MSPAGRSKNYKIGKGVALHREYLCYRGNMPFLLLRHYEKYIYQLFGRPKHSPFIDRSNNFPEAFYELI